MPTNRDRRDRLADAGLALLAREGARGVTYRALEGEAGLPAGTTSNYYRSRDELLGDLARRVFERLAPDQDSPADEEPPHADGTVTSYMLALHERLEDRADVYRALLELRLESARRPEVRRRVETVLRDGFEADVAFHESRGLPGGRRAVRLLHLAMAGLMLERLTVSAAMADTDVEQTVAELVECLVPEPG
jgi:AcrR family transcriptional regulator